LSRSNLRPVYGPAAGGKTGISPPGNLDEEQKIFRKSEVSIFIPIYFLQYHLIYRCQAKFLTSSHVRMHRTIFYISNTLRKLMLSVWCLGKCVGLRFGLEFKKN